MTKNALNTEIYDKRVNENFKLPVFLVPQGLQRGGNASGMVDKGV